MSEAFGFTIIDESFLQKSSEQLGASQLHLEELKEEDSYLIENRFYKIKLGHDGQIHSWRDKRTKNFEREICRKGDTINKIAIH